MTAGSYSGNPQANRKDAIRALVGDTGSDDGQDFYLSDNEINYLITRASAQVDDDFYVAAIVADVLANRFAAQVSISADGVSIGADQLQQKFTQVAASLRQTYKQLAGVEASPFVGGVDKLQLFDPSLRPGNFGVGQDDNVRAGLQINPNLVGDGDNEGYPSWLDSSPW